MSNRSGKSKSIENSNGVRRTNAKGEYLAPKGLRRKLRAEFYNRTRRILLNDATDAELLLLKLTR